MKLSKYKIWAGLFAKAAVRDTYLEKLHIGKFPTRKIGDYSDMLSLLMEKFL